MQHDSCETAEGHGGGEGEYAANFVRAAECVSVSRALAFGLESSFGLGETRAAIATDSGFGINLGQSETLPPPEKSRT